MTAFPDVAAFDAFYGARQILNGVDVDVRRGGQIGLDGRNNMDKTTGDFASIGSQKVFDTINGKLCR